MGPDRHCVVCIAGCSNGRYQGLQKFLTTHGYDLSKPSAGAAWFLCSCCVCLADVPNNMKLWSTMVAAGLLCTAMRLYPGHIDWEHKNLSRVKKHMLKASFTKTKHGSADYRTDRCSLFRYRPMRRAYSQDRISLFFGPF